VFGPAHFLVPALMALRLDLAALVCGRFVVVGHHQPVTAHVARTRTDFLRSQED
jgi:hypothetical protein